MINQPSKQNSQHQSASKGRSFLVGLLLGIGVIALSNWLILRWLNTYIFNTQNYVQTVAPLTKNEAVATALSKFATAKLYSSIDLETEVRQALPEKAAFIAPPLAGQIISTTEQIGTNLITSDQFNNLWVSANEAAHSRLMTTISRPQAEFNIERDRAVFGINITPLLERLRSRLQSQDSNSIVSNIRDSRTAEVVVNLRNRIQALRITYQYTQTFYVILPMLFLAAYLGAIAIAHQRWKATLAVTLSVAIVAAIELILLKATRPEIINNISTTYQAAGGVVWDSLTTNFNQVITNTLILSVVATGIVMVFGPFGWAKQLRSLIGIDKLRNTQLHNYLELSRQWLRKNIISWRIGAALLALLVLIIKPTINWQTIVQTILVYCIFISTIEIVATHNS